MFGVIQIKIWRLYHTLNRDIVTQVISEEYGIYHIAPYYNSKAFIKSILEKSKDP